MVPNFAFKQNLCVQVDLRYNLCIHVIGHFTVVYLVAKPLVWSEAEGDLVVLETRI